MEIKRVAALKCGSHYLRREALVTFLAVGVLTILQRKVLKRYNGLQGIKPHLWLYPLPCCLAVRHNLSGSKPVGQPDLTVAKRRVLPDHRWGILQATQIFPYHKPDAATI